MYWEYVIYYLNNNITHNMKKNRLPNPQVNKFAKTVGVPKLLLSPESRIHVATN